MVCSSHFGCFTTPALRLATQITRFTKQNGCCKRRNHHRINAITVFGNAISVFGNAIPVFGNAIPVFGNAIPVFGDTITVFGNAISIFGNTIPVFGDAIPVFGDAMTVFINSCVYLYGGRRNFTCSKPVFRFPIVKSIHSTQS